MKLINPYINSNHISHELMPVYKNVQCDTCSANCENKYLKGINRKFINLCNRWRTWYEIS